MNGPLLDRRTDVDQTCIGVSSRLVSSIIGYLAHVIHNKTNILNYKRQQTKTTFTSIDNSIRLDTIVQFTTLEILGCFSLNTHG